jgi:hypothetical protein
MKLMSRYKDKNRSGYECSMVWHKLYSETDPSVELKEGVGVGEEVGTDDGTVDGRDDGAVEGRDDGAVVGLEDGVVVRAGLYSQPQ